MKKGILLGIIIASGCFLSCQGHGNKDKETVSNEKIEMSSTDLEGSKSYKFEDGRIIPTSGLPMIVDFSATWCPPCRQLKPIFEKLAEEFHGRVDFVTIDVDDYPEISQAYDVQNIPTMIFFNKDGQLQNTIIGFQNRDQLLSAINTYFGF